MEAEAGVQSVLRLCGVSDALWLLMCWLVAEVSSAFLDLSMLIGTCFAYSGPHWHTQEEVQGEVEIEAGTQSVLCVRLIGVSDSSRSMGGSFLPRGCPWFPLI